VPESDGVIVSDKQHSIVTAGRAPISITLFCGSFVILGGAANPGIESCSHKNVETKDGYCQNMIT